jgi:predicted DNA-binding transcriptional regulator AlpA
MVARQLSRRLKPRAPLQDPDGAGDHHKYLQQIIKEWAEGRGFTVATEKPILDGLGSVDVAIQKANRSIACEISVTTDAEHEIGNVQKCLAAGFDEVIVVSSEKRVLNAVRKELAGALNAGQYRRIEFLTPEETFSFIESLEVQRAAAGGPAPDPQEILTAAELEAMLRIDRKTIYSYVQKGLIPYVKMQSNLRFIRSEILKWMEERQYKPGGRPGRKSEK